MATTTTKRKAKPKPKGKEKNTVTLKLRDAEIMIKRLARLDEDSREVLMTDDLIVELNKIKEQVKAIVAQKGDNTSEEDDEVAKEMARA